MTLRTASTHPFPAVECRPMAPEDVPAVLSIHADGIATGLATFREAAPLWDGWDSAFHPEPRMVAERDDTVVGWAAVAPTSGRPVYRGVAEVSVYIRPDLAGGGIGRALMAAFVPATEAAGFWTLQAVVFTANAASRRLHERAGFRLVGTRERIGLMAHGPLAGQWLDTALYERRSPVVGG